MDFGGRIRGDWLELEIDFGGEFVGGGEKFWFLRLELELGAEFERGRGKGRAVAHWGSRPEANSLLCSLKSCRSEEYPRIVDCLSLKPVPLTQGRGILNAHIFDLVCTIFSYVPL